MYTGFIVAIVGGTILLSYGLSHQESFVFLFCVMLANFGTNVCFNTVYALTPRVFPTLFAASAFGICNVFARVFSSMSSLFAGMEQPTPMILFTVMAVVACLAMRFLDIPKKKLID